MTNETAIRHTPKHSHSSRDSSASNWQPQSQCYERHQYLLSSSKWKKSRPAVPSNRNYGFCLKGLKCESVQKTRSSNSMRQSLRKFVSVGSKKNSALLCELKGSILIRHRCCRDYFLTVDKQKLKLRIVIYFFVRASKAIMSMSMLKNSFVLNQAVIW